MSKSKDVTQKVADFFESNPERKKVFSTSDGFLFIQKQDGVAHAKTLEGKEVVTHKREQEEPSETEIEDTNNQD